MAIQGNEVWIKRSEVSHCSIFKLRYRELYTNVCKEKKEGVAEPGSEYIPCERGGRSGGRRLSRTFFFSFQGRKARNSAAAV